MIFAVGTPSTIMEPLIIGIGLAQAALHSVWTVFGNWNPLQRRLSERQSRLYCSTHPLRAPDIARFDPPVLGLERSYDLAAILQPCFVCR